MLSSRTMNVTRRALMGVALAGSFAVVGIARADIISDEQSACRGAKAGAACELDGTAGVCTASKCSRLDYSEGTPPKSVSTDCMVCKPGSDSAPAPTPDAEPTPTKTESETKTETKTDTKAGTNTAPTAETKTAPATADAKPAAKQGCSTAATAGDPLALGVIVLGLGLVALGRTRRDR